MSTTGNVWIVERSIDFTWADTVIAVQVVQRQHPLQQQAEELLLHHGNPWKRKKVT